MSTLRFLRTFLAVARADTFASAADEVGLTQAAVSFQMRALEKALNRRLFDRSGRLARLNAAGRALVPQAQDLLAHYDRLRHPAPPPGQLGGSLAIGAIVSCMGQLAHAVSDLKHVHPAVQVRVHAGKSAALAGMVAAGELDAALLVHPPRRPAGCAWTALFQEPMAIITPSRLHAPCGPPATLLSQHPFLRFDRSQHTGRLVDQALRAMEIQVQEFLELNAIETIIELVKQGVGVTLLPLPQHASWPSSAELRCHPLPGDLTATRDIGLLARNDVEDPRLLAAITQQLGRPHSTADH